MSSNHRWRRRTGIGALAALIACVALTSYAIPDVYVDPAGNDANAGDLGNPVATISQGITLVDSGGTVHVAAGTYIENIGVTKSLTIDGAGKDQTIIAPSGLMNASLAHHHGGNPAMVGALVNGAAAVTIKDLAFDLNTVPNYNAILFWNASSGTIDNVKFTADAVWSSMTGHALQVDASAPSSTNLTVTGCEFAKWNRNAIDCVNGNAGLTGGGDITLNVVNSTLTGRNDNSVCLQNGINVWDRAGGTVSATIDGVTISNLAYNLDGWESFGVIGSDNGTVTVKNSTFTNCVGYLASGYGPIDATDNNVFDGVNVGTATLPQLLAINDKIWDAISDPLYGKVVIKANQLFVLAGSGTIQNAVDIAAAGDTVNVGAGTYTEAVVVNKPLTLVGVGNPAVTAPAGTNQKLIHVQASNVTISGFNLNVNRPNAAAGIYADNQDEIQVIGNTITSFGTGSSLVTPYGNVSAAGVAIVAGSIYPTATIRGNTITGDIPNNSFFTRAIWLKQGNGIVGGDNPADGNTLVGLAQDILIAFAAGGPTLVKNNTMLAAGFDITEPNASGPVTIDSNTIAPGAPAWAYISVVKHATSPAVAITNNTFNIATAGLVVGGSKNVTVSGNTFDGGTSEQLMLDTSWPGTVGGIAVPVEAVVQNNQFTGAASAGISVLNGRKGAATPDFGNVVVSGNSFAPGLGMFIKMSNVAGKEAVKDLDVAANTFDLGSGPVQPASMSIADFFAMENKIFHKVDVPLTGLVSWKANNVYVTTPGAGSTDSSITNAVKAVPTGGQVNVEAGTYVEGVDVNKPCTLVSVSGAATTLIDGTGSARPTSVGNQVAVNMAMPNVPGALILDGFTITGTSPVQMGVLVSSLGALGGLSGPQAADSSFEVKNCVFDAMTTDGVAICTMHVGLAANTVGLIHDNEIKNSGAGIRITNSSNVQMLNNNIHDNDSYGVFVMKSNEAAAYGFPAQVCQNNLVAENTIVNNGSDSVNAAYGVLMGQSPTAPPPAPMGRNNAVTSNTISGNEYEGLYFQGQNTDSGSLLVSANTITSNSIVYDAAVRAAGGIALINSKGVVIEYNHISNNYYTGIYMNSASSANVVNRNNIFGHAPAAGLQNNNATFTVDATNNWWGSYTGPGSTDAGGRIGDTVVGQVTSTPYTLGQYSKDSDSDTQNDNIDTDDDNDQYTDANEANVLLTDPLDFYVNTAPVASAGGPYNIMAGNSVQLDGTASSEPDAAGAYADSIVSYEWDLDSDGDYEVTGVQPTVSWATLQANGITGPYSGNVTLRVTDEVGAVDTATASLVVEVMPTASFTAIPNPAAPTQTISFDGTGSTQPSVGKSIVSWAWDFGDGSPAGSGSTVTHAYGAFGSYTVTLTVTDNSVPPRVDTETLTINVNQGNRVPVANAAGPYVILAGNSLSLNGSGSSDPDVVYGDSIVSYEWDVTTNGSYDVTGSQPTITWANLQSYGVTSPFSGDVRLRVTDEFGAQGTVTTALTVYQYQVTFATDGTAGASLTGTTSQMVNSSGSCTPVTANAPAGMKFVRWMNGATEFSTANPLTVTNPTSSLNLMAEFAEAVAPASALTALADTTLARASVALPFTASDAGSGVASTELWVKAPGAPAFVSAGVSQPGTSGSFNYTFAAGDGVYEFATKATDNAANAEADPAAPDVSLVVNTAANTSFSQTFATGAGTQVFPMTDELDVRITLAAGTPGAAITVARVSPARGSAPAYFKVPAQLLDESLQITATGLSAGFTANVEWNYTLANAPAGGVNTVWRFDGGATPASTYAVTPSGGVMTITGVTTFSNWYAGNSVAVPVHLSEFAIE